MSNPMSIFKNANLFNASAKLFDQAILVDKLPMSDPARSGVCRGVCLAYAGLTKIGTGFDGATEYVRALALYAAKLQNEIDLGQATTMIPALIHVINNNGKAAGLAVFESECKTLNWPCTKEAANDTIKLTSSGKYFLIFLPNHWICTRMGNDGAAYLFDPNYGEVRCDRDKFYSVLNLFLTHPEIKSDYQLVDGANIHVIATY